MEFYISDTFTESLKKLSNSEQKQIKTTVFDYQTNPSHPSLQFHRIDRAKDGNFWSIRVSEDLRIVLHKKEDRSLLCYVDHHDRAYQWAEKRKIEIHPKTGAVQLVVVPEIVESQVSQSKKKKWFQNTPSELILACGVPEDWLERIRETDEDSLFDFLNYLPAEAGEALLDLVAGKKPVVQIEKKDSKNPFEHPDSQRRFKLVTGQGELEEALLASWSKWAVYLHPLQKSIVEKEYKGPVRVSGSAGTGKTIVALHRATHLAKKFPESKLLLATFSDILADSLHQNFIRLVSTQPEIAERVEVNTLQKLGLRLHKRYFGESKILLEGEFQELLLESLKKETSLSLASNLVYMEVLQILSAWNLQTWEDYKDFKRLGRRTRLKESQRKEIWDFYVRQKEILKSDSKITLPEAYFKIAGHLSQQEFSLFDAVIVDEAQDLSPSQMTFISSLSKEKKNFFFSGDLGQRIFQIPFSWNSFGMDIRGRSYTLKVNYRTSEQIRTGADKLLSKEISDYDGNIEKRIETISLFQGPKPEVHLFTTEAEEAKANSDWIRELSSQGVPLQEILIVVRSLEEKSRLSLLKEQGIDFTFLETEKTSPGKVSACTMHSAKGLEYRIVLIMGCDSNVIPKSSRLEKAGDESELEEIYATERQLLYVACTRARDLLRITGLKPGSEYLEDMRG